VELDVCVPEHVCAGNTQVWIRVGMASRIKNAEAHAAVGGGTTGVVVGEVGDLLATLALSGLQLYVWWSTRAGWPPKRARLIFGFPNGFAEIARNVTKNCLTFTLYLQGYDRKSLNFSLRRSRTQTGRTMPRRPPPTENPSTNTDPDREEQPPQQPTIANTNFKIRLVLALSVER
jgi:hypothetical protein